ncbi:DUF2500 domain-containing protein [Ornithinimicrobium ciconiae]|uniref:DUF2500 domain-containing protein n=1 Tax=Ornithinimicrobium ciconiae TaxID=2594265 RepID=A0A516GAM3_9MICO|nr:DUF2500 domain-containing protein [Ornithinimicrobium ciconiae]QDO88548.1 DUF2500 domain-containing protein [Ornithinimicrobium ciconiae]
MDMHVFSWMFIGVPAFIGLIWLIILGTIGWRVWKAWDQRRSNESEPVLAFPARVIGKRDSVSGGNNSTRTHYYVTFERLDLQRLELEVEGPEFGMLAVGDTGRLTHQGSWYQGFVRDTRPTPPPA